MKISILLSVAVLLAGCRTVHNNSWPITPKNKTAAQLIKLDSTSRAIMANHNLDSLSLYMAKQLDMQGVDDLGLRQQRDSANYVWHEFIVLCNENKQKEAFELYKKHWSLFLIVPEHSTARFHLHHLTGIMAYDYMPEKEAYAFVLRDFEFDLFVAEAILLVSEGQTTPEHYEDLLWTLMDCYCDNENWDKALEMNDKLKNLYREDGIKMISIAIHRAGIYNSMGDTAQSLELLRDLKEIVESAMTDDNDSVQLQGALIAINNKISELEQ